jgi:hypothetical protein
VLLSRLPTNFATIDTVLAERSELHVNDVFPSSIKPALIFSYTFFSSPQTYKAVHLQASLAVRDFAKSLFYTFAAHDLR